MFEFLKVLVCEFKTWYFLWNISRKQFATEFCSSLLKNLKNQVLFNCETSNFSVRNYDYGNILELRYRRKSSPHLSIESWEKFLVMWTTWQFLRMKLLDRIVFWTLPDIWDKVSKNGPSKICQRLSSTNFTWSILKYFVPSMMEPFCENS